MPNRRTHVLAGVLAAAGTNYIIRRRSGHPCSVGDTVAAGILGAGFGVLPDILEPALYPFHRALFHSGLAAALIGFANWKAMASPTLPQVSKTWLAVASAAYLSHLLLDANTPMRIPVFGYDA